MTLKNLFLKSGVYLSKSDIRQSMRFLWYLLNPSEIYTLNPLRQIQKFLLYGRVEENDSQYYFSLEELLMQQPTINKIKDLSTFFAVTAIPFGNFLGGFISETFTISPSSYVTLTLLKKKYKCFS